MRTSQEGINLIKSFEGLQLKAYVCPAGVLTIGYGHTLDVKPGQVITEKQAEDLLRKDLIRFEESVEKNITVPLNQQQFDALVSFTFNCGTTALAQSTLRKRLNNKEDPNKVAQQELPKWVNGDNGPLPGLVRRREAEVKLFCSGQPVVVKLIDICSVTNTYIKKEPIQSQDLPSNEKAWIKKDRTYKGVRVLQKKDDHTQVVLPYGLGTWWLFDEHWYGLGGVLHRPENKQDVKYDGVLLAVPYQSQRDNYRDANRTCFSSSCAMAAMYLRPGCIANDNEYIKKVFAIGDTTQAATQVKVLNSFGVVATFRQDGKIDDLIVRLNRNIPCPIGILHKGPKEKPSGGGHWICVIGYEDELKRFIVHDPWGEIDHATGTYISTNGERLYYSYNLLRSRWTVEGNGTGWWLDLK
jgi:GH24 family phage-related lysozyme (muramidase)